MTFIKVIASLIVIFIASSNVNAEQAKNDECFKVNVPTLNAAEAMNMLVEQTGVRLLFPYDLVRVHQAKAVRGCYTLEQAINIMLEGTGLVSGLSEEGLLMISNKKSQAFNRDKNMGKDKMNSKKKLLASIVSFFVGSGGQLAFSQEDPSDSTSWLFEEIVVTAQKRGQQAVDVPISIVAIGEEELKIRGIEDFKDLGLAVPGLSVQDSGTFQRRIFLRGVANTTGSSSLVGIYMDEVSLSGGSPSSQLDIRTHDLERVEVLRGPQGTLYGQGSVGGTIRFITNKPDFDGFSGSAGVSASHTENGDESYAVDAVLNVPLVQDKLAMRLVTVYEDTGGWIDQPAAGEKDINDEEVKNIRLSMLWRPTDDLEVTAMINSHRNEAGAPPVAEDDDGNYTNISGRGTIPSTDDDYDIYNLTVGYDFSNINVLSITSLIEASQESSGGLVVPAEIPGISLGFTAGGSGTDIFTQEFRLSSDNSDNWAWSAGLIYQDSDADFETNGIELYLGDLLLQTTSGSEGGEESSSWALFGQASVDLTEKWEVGFGLRYFEDSRDTYGTSIETKSEDFDSLSPRLFARYSLSDDVNLYSSIAHGFRSGGQDRNVVGSPGYGPEDSWTFELGAKSTSLMDGRLSGDIALFFTRYEEYQSLIGFGGETGVQRITGNVGTAEIIGLEWSVNWRATDALTLGFDGTHLDTEFVDVNADPRVAAYFEGDPIDFTAENQITIFSQYNSTVASLPSYIRLDYNYKDSVTLRNRFQNIFFESDEIEMLNVILGLELNEKTSVTLFARNLLKEDGLRDASATSPRPRPLEFGANVSFDF